MLLFLFAWFYKNLSLILSSKPLQAENLDNIQMHLDLNFIHSFHFPEQISPGALGPLSLWTVSCWAWCLAVIHLCPHHLGIHCTCLLPRVSGSLHHIFASFSFTSSGWQSRSSNSFPRKGTCKINICDPEGVKKHPHSLLVAWIDI